MSAAPSWFRRRQIEVPCTLDIAHTAETLHAHAEPAGVAIEPGDRVIIHGAPRDVPFGTTLKLDCRATIIRANRFDRLWVRIAALFELTELYEVSFSARLKP